MTIHARLDNPLELRRDILECAVISTDAVRCGENIRELEREKKKLNTQLKKNLNELKKMISNTEKDLPKLPKEENMRARKEDMRMIMQEDISEELGEVKPFEEIRKNIENISKKDLKKLKKKAASIEERRSLNEELDMIRSRIAGLNRLIPEE